MDLLSTGSLFGKTALITGAAKRMGHAVALALAAQGVRVVVHYHHSRVEAEELAAGIRDYGVRAWAVEADLSQTSEAEELIGRIVELAGPIDILVNNASIFPADRFLDVAPDALHSNVQVNALAPFLISRKFAGQTRQGVIINFLDARIHDYDKEHFAYHLSKRMLFSMTRMLALDLAPGIRVNAVAPGLILPPEGKDEGYLNQLAHSNPMNRHGDLRDVTNAVLFLIRAEFVTGQIIYVDGGRHLKGNMYGG